MTGATARPNVVVDAKNVLSRNAPDGDDNDTLPSLNTKVDEIEEDGIPIMQDMLTAPLPMRRTIVNDKSTILSNLTMDTRMDAVKNVMLITNTNIGNLDYSVNFMNCLLINFIKEFKQDANTEPTSDHNEMDEQTLAQQTSTRVVEALYLGNQIK